MSHPAPPPETHKPRLTCDQEIAWLREGIEEAIRMLKEDRKSVALNVLLGTLAGEEGCW